MTKPLESASIEYKLPRTDAIVQLGLTLKECREDGFNVASELHVIAKAGAQEQVLHVSGEKLASARIKRDLKLTISDQGVITGINAAAVDQTPGIIGTALKAAAAIAVAATAKGPSGLTCRDEVIAATGRVIVIRDQMKKLREKLAGSGELPSPTDLERMRQLNRLARELASLQSGLLHVDIEGKIKLEGATVGSLPVKMDYAPLAKWLDDPSRIGAAKFDEYFGLTWTAAVANAAPKEAIEGGGQHDLRDCGLSILLPKVSGVTLVASGAGTSVKGLTQEIAFPAAQISKVPSKLCLDVGFGESRSVSLTFDQFGQTREFAWSSEASAATVAAALADGAADAASLAKVLRGPSQLERQKAEIDRLETQQKLNKLRACQAVIDAGGSECGSGDE